MARQQSARGPIQRNVLAQSPTSEYLLEEESNHMYIVPVLAKAIAILESVREAGPDGLRLSEIHQRTKVPKSSAFRILRTFVIAGYITHNHDRTYVLARTLDLPQGQAPSYRGRRSTSAEVEALMQGSVPVQAAWSQRRTRATLEELNGHLALVGNLVLQLHATLT